MEKNPYAPPASNLEHALREVSETGRRLLLFVVASLIASLAGCATPVHGVDTSDSTYRDEIAAGVEEIYITRTTRTQYTPGPTATCSAAPFPTVSEQHYETWSLGVSPSDASVTKTHERLVGEFTACFASVGSNGTFALYSRGKHEAISYTSVGECKFMKSKPPAPKLLVLSCNGDLSELPTSYIGGYLTTSSLAPSGGKDATHVRGYLSTSVMTMRLWKKPLAPASSTSQ
jgi:hypothetical protein